MKTDGPVYSNPVVLSVPVREDEYTSLLSTLPEYRYRNRIVGFTDREFFVCTKRVAKSGYYEMICEPIPRMDLNEIKCGRFFSMESLLLGIGLVILGLVLLDAGWISQTHTGPAVYWMPFAAPIAGIWLIVYCRRLRIVARTAVGKLWWVAPPGFQAEQELRQLLNLPDKPGK